MALGAFAYNILRFIGQTGLIAPFGPRHSAKRTAENRNPRVDVSGRPADQHWSAIEVAFQPTLPGFHRFQCRVLAAGPGQVNKNYQQIRLIQDNCAFALPNLRFFKEQDAKVIVAFGL
jgi:hypothetical protein